MKKVLRIVAVVVALLLAGAQFVRPSRLNPPVAEGSALEHHVTVTPEAGAVLERACMDCHSNRTVWPWYSNVAPVSWFVADHVNHGRSHLNFSDWSRYDARESAEMLEQVCREAKSGQMPLDSYVMLHPDAKLTTEDVRTLCDWAAREGGRLAARGR